jgi:hypothetical protein
MAEHFVADGSVYPYWDSRLERRPSIDNCTHRQVRC